MYGTVLIGFNPAKVKAALGDNAPVDSWDLVFKPENMEKLKSCGVAMLDSPSEILPLALHYLGLDPNSQNPADYEKAKDLMLKIPSVRDLLQLGQVHDRHRQRRHLRGHRLLRQLLSVRQPCERGGQRCGGRLALAEGRRARSGSTPSPFRRARRMSKRPMNSSTPCSIQSHCADQRLPRLPEREQGFDAAGEQRHHRQPEPDANA
jgi:hypothetical protein